MGKMIKNRGGIQEASDKGELLQYNEVQESPLVRVVQNGFVLAMVFFVFIILLLIMVSYWAIEIASGLSVLRAVLGMIMLIMIVFFTPSFFRFIGKVYEDYKFTQNTALINAFFLRLLGFLTLGLTIITFFTVLNISLIVHAYSSINEGGNPVVQGASIVHEILK